MISRGGDRVALTPDEIFGPCPLDRISIPRREPAKPRGIIALEVAPDGRPGVFHAVLAYDDTTDLGRQIASVNDMVALAAAVRLLSGPS